MNKSVFLMISCLLTGLIGFLPVAAATGPTANPDTFQTTADQALFLDVLANDFNTSGNLMLVKLGVNDPNQKSILCNGQLCATIINNRDGTLIYRPDPGYSGTVTFTYVLADANDPEAPTDTGTVTVDVTGGQGAATLAFVSHPQATVANLGGQGIFTATASGDNLSFIWRKSGVNLTPSAKYVITSDATGSQLAITNVDSEDIGHYRCVVTRDAAGGGRDTLISNAGHLRVNTDGFTSVPIKNSPTQLPALLQAEDYNIGNPGVSHHDLTAGNAGDLYRTGDADIFEDNTGNYFLGDIQAGEWLEYGISNLGHSTYDLVLTAAADPALATQGIRLHLQMNGEPLVCERVFGTTANGEDWQTFIIPGIPISDGQHRLRLVADSGGWHLDQFEFVPVTGIQAPFTAGGQPHGLGLIEIEDYDLGGQGMAYQDMSSGNNGNFCGRDPDWVDLFESPGLIHLASIEPGEWLEYTVDLGNSGSYDFALSHVSTGGSLTDGAVRLEIPAAGFSLPIILPASQNWTTTTLPALSLPTGVQTLRLAFDSSNLGINSFTIGEIDPIRVTEVDGTPVAGEGQVHSLGQVLTNTPASFQFQIHNDHPSLALSIQNPTVIGQNWTLSQPPPASIPAGGSGQFSVTVNTASAGTSRATIRFDSSGANGSGFVFSGEVNATTALSSMGLDAWFGAAWNSLNHNSNYPMLEDQTIFSFRVQNTDAVHPLTITAIQLESTSNWKLQAANYPVTLSPGQIHNSSVALLDTNVDQHQVKVTVFANAPTSPFVFFVAKLVNFNEPVAVVTQPQSVAIPHGGSVQLSVQAVGGSGSYLYEWHRQALFADIEPIIPSDYPPGTFVGVDQPTLTINNPPDDGRNRYVCVVKDASNPIFLARSESAWVTEYHPLAILNQPQDQYAAINDNITFSVNADAGGAPLIYNWEHRPIGGTWTSVPGNHGASLTLTGVQAGQAGHYRCRIEQESVAENVITSASAFLSFIKINHHPADMFGINFASFHVDVAAAGHALTYQWFTDDGFPIGEGGLYRGTQTATLSVLGEDFISNNRYFCRIEDGLTHVNSRVAGKRRPFGVGLTAAETFNRGQIGTAPLDEQHTAWGHVAWEASVQIGHEAGEAFNLAGTGQSPKALIPFLPAPDTDLRIEFKGTFDTNSDNNDAIDVGFFSGTSAHIWMRLRKDLSIELWAGDQMLGNANVARVPFVWALAFNVAERQVSIGDGNNTFLAAFLPIGFTPTVTRAGFRFQLNRPAGDYAGGELRLQEIWFRQMPPFLVVDDTYTLDRSQAASLQLEPLANDIGENLLIGQSQPLTPQHGTVVQGSGQRLIYTPESNWTGWDTFYYEGVQGADLLSATGTVRIFTHDGPVLHAELDQLQILINQTQALDILANDLSTEGESFQLSASDPFPTAPNHGVLTLAPDNTLSYTPNTDFAGLDRFQYRIESDSGKVATAWVELSVIPPYQGGWADSFTLGAEGRGRFMPLKGQATEIGAAIWHIAARNGIYSFGNNNVFPISLGGATSSSMPYIHLPRGIDQLLGPVLGDDFESGNANAWYRVQDIEGRLSFDQQQPIAGSTSLKLQLPGGGVNQPRAALLTTFNEEVHRQQVSFVFRSENFSGNAGAVSICRANSPGGGGYFLQYGVNPVPQMRLIAIQNDGKWITQPWRPLDLSLPIQHIDIEWWAGRGEQVAGGARFHLNGELVTDLADFPNHGQILTRLWLGNSSNANSSISGELWFDDVLIQNAGEVALEHSIRFAPGSDLNEQAIFGWFHKGELDFHQNGQTALYVSLFPGGYKVKETNSAPSFQDHTLTQGSFAHIAGQAVSAVLHYDPYRHAIALYIDGQRKVDWLPVNVELDTRLMQRAGFYLTGNLLPTHRVWHFGMQNSRWPTLATDDAYELYLNEILTVDLRSNDLNAPDTIVKILKPPGKGQIMVNDDATVSYRPDQAGEDSFTYALGKNGIFSQAQVRLVIDPVAGPQQGEPIPLVATSNDPFESRTTGTWAVQGDPGRFKFQQTNPISGLNHLEFNLPENFAQTTTLRHSEPKGRNYLHMAFDFRPEGLALAPDQTQQAIMHAWGPSGRLFNLLYRESPSPSLFLQGLSKSGPWTGSGWQNLDIALNSNAIEIEWWGTHPGYAGGGLRLWINGSMVYEVTDFTFRHDLIQHIDIGWASLPLAGTSGQFSLDNFALRRSAYVAQFTDDFEAATPPWDSWFDPNQLSSLTTVDPLRGNASFAVDERGTNDQRAYLSNSGSPTSHFRMQVKMAAREVIMDAAASHLFLSVKDGTEAVARGAYRHHPEPGVLFHGFRPDSSWTSGGWRSLPVAMGSSGVLFEGEWWSDLPFKTGGGIRLWLDGQAAFDMSTADHGERTAESYFLGITAGLDPGTDGLFLFDDFVWWTYEVRE